MTFAPASSLDTSAPHLDLLTQHPVLDGRYQLLDKIGEGAMGMVFRARQLSTGQHVAIKLIKPDQGANAAIMQRFKREAAIIAELRHPHIVRLLDLGEDRELELSYIVMEHVEGTTLGHYLHDQPEPMRAQLGLALHIVLQVCNALTEPHHKGIIHRDIKPDNILLGVRSDELINVKLLDFGVAHISSHEDSSQGSSQRLTSTGCIVGTPHYLAPELCHTSKATSPASDLYAVGVLLFELLAGYSPFHGESVVDILFRHAHDEIPEIVFEETVDSACADELNTLLGELLAKDPDMRPGSALEVGQRIAAMCARHAISAPHLNQADPVKSLMSHFCITGGSTRSDELLKHTQLSPVPHMAYVETLDDSELAVTRLGTGELVERATPEPSSDHAYAGLAASLHAMAPIQSPHQRTRANGSRTMEFLNYEDGPSRAAKLMNALRHKLTMMSAAAFIMVVWAAGAISSTTSAIEAQPQPNHNHTPAVLVSLEHPEDLIASTSSRGISHLINALPEAPKVHGAPELELATPELTHTHTAKARAASPSKPRKHRDHMDWLYTP